MTDNTVLYVYCMIRGGEALWVSGGDSRLYVVESPLASAVVEKVSAEQFSAAAVEAGLQSLEWVVPLARRHQNIVEQVAQCAPVIPARLCTLFSDVSALERYLERNGKQLHKMLDSLHSLQEWSIKLYCNQDRLRSVLAAADPRAQRLIACATSPGQAFIARKRRDSFVDDLAQVRLESVASEVIQAVKETADEARERPLMSETFTGRSVPMSLNIAALVSEHRVRRLTESLSALDRSFKPEGFEIAVSGPWPPYSFVDKTLALAPSLSTH
jgi:hypothetical protein